MNSLDEIEAAIARLRPDDFWKLTDRLIERLDTEWNSQLETDGLDGLWTLAEKEIKAGEYTSLDSFLDKDKFSH